MDCPRISQDNPKYTAIISLYNINGPVTVVETDCVLCEVGNEFHVAGMHFSPSLALPLGRFCHTSVRPQTAHRQRFRFAFLVATKKLG